jgi:cephalosporin-C deacetylase-like acetyl esterase
MGQWANPYKMPGPPTRAADRVRAEGNGWWIQYRFLPDAIELSYFGAPESGRGFRAGYPPAELALSLASGVHRVCDADNQGELGWPVTRAHEPGNFAVLAANGAGFAVDGVCRMESHLKDGRIRNPSGRLDFLVFNTYDQTAKPLEHTLKIFARPPVRYALTMDIISPNPNHVFPSGTDAAFPIRVRALYGQTLKGSVRFEGAPYVWKTPEVTADTPLDLTGGKSESEVTLTIRPPKPGHYTGLISVTDGQVPLYSKRIGFLYQSEKVPAAQPPADFDAFWGHTMAELAKIPLDMTLEPQKEMETAAGQVFKVKYRSWAGRWAWAWLTVPKADGKFPATVVCPAVSVWQPGRAQPAGGELRMSVAVHGGDLSDYPAKPDFDYMNSGITSRETYMLRYSFCCLARCFDIMQGHAKCNGTVDVQGGSQGAGLSLVLAGLRRPATVKASGIALCRIDWTVLGHTEWGPRCPEGEDPKRIAGIVAYFDPANFAHRIRAPLRLGLGLFDFCAPAEGIVTAINALPRETTCEVFIDPYGGHFSLHLPAFGSGEKGLEIPRWYGTTADNKLGR